MFWLSSGLLGSSSHPAHPGNSCHINRDEYIPQTDSDHPINNIHNTLAKIDWINHESEVLYLFLRIWIIQYLCLFRRWYLVQFNTNNCVRLCVLWIWIIDCLSLTLYWLTCNSVISFSAILGSELPPWPPDPAPPAPWWPPDPEGPVWPGPAEAGDQEGAWLLATPQNEAGEEADMSPIMFEPCTCIILHSLFFNVFSFTSNYQTSGLATHCQIRPE